KNACWELPKPFSKLHPSDAGCAFLRNAFIPIQTKSTPKADAKSTFGVLCLPALLPIFFGLFFFQKAFQILLRPQELLHLVAGAAVLRVDRFLLLEQLGILGVQLLHLGQLLDTLL